MPWLYRSIRHRMGGTRSAHRRTVAVDSTNRPSFPKAASPNPGSPSHYLASSLKSPGTPSIRPRDREQNNKAKIAREYGQVRSPGSSQLSDSSSLTSPRAVKLLNERARRRHAMPWGSTAALGWLVGRSYALFGGMHGALLQVRQALGEWEEIVCSGQRRRSFSAPCVRGNHKGLRTDGRRKS